MQELAFILSTLKYLLSYIAQHFILLSYLAHSYRNIHFNVLDVGSSGRVVERRTVNQGCSITRNAVSKLRQFRSPHICLCLSDQTLKPEVPSIWCLYQGKLDFKTACKGPRPVSERRREGMLNGNIKAITCVCHLSATSKHCICGKKIMDTMM